MKRLLITSWGLIASGLIFRLLHYPGASFLLVVGTFLLVLESMIYFIKNAKANLPNSLLKLSYSLLTVYALFRIQYWPMGPIFMGYYLSFVVVALVTITSFILISVRRIPFRLSQRFLVVYFAFVVILSFTSSHRIYYFFYLNKLLNTESRNHDFRSWDKYSWFLYIAGNQEEALQANKNAESAIQACLNTSDCEGAIPYSNVVKQHRKLIQGRNWTDYEY